MQTWGGDLIDGTFDVNQEDESSMAIVAVPLPKEKVDFM